MRLNRYAIAATVATLLSAAAPAFAAGTTDAAAQPAAAAPAAAAPASPAPAAAPAAATTPPQVPDAVKEERNQTLLSLLAANSDRRNATLVGTVEEVLVEGPDKKGRSYTGRTRGNRVVHFAASDRLVGQLVPIRIERVSTAVLYGSLELAGVNP